MRDNAKPIDPRWAWEPYRPSKEAPWNLQRVGHLYRRAAFGATLEQLQKGVKDGPDATIEALFRGGEHHADFDKTTATLQQSIADGNLGGPLRGWWLRLMLYGPNPMLEKLTLFWHNHFATSNVKVNNARFMLGQYELMKKYALGSFEQMLQEMSKDPAMMVWLDTRGSKKGNPNENYAREIMELFSLGVGNYTETDIREAARAFTGWNIVGNEVVFNADSFDDGEKTVFGETGKFKMPDIVRLCLEKPCCPKFVVTKFFRFMVSETIEPTPELIDPLAEKFKTSGYDFGAVVKTVLHSNLFFSPQAYRSRIKSPVEFILGIVHALGTKEIGTTQLAAETEKLGQNVFNPPSVKGWDGGRTWLNASTLLDRQNLALAMTSTEDVRFNNRLDPAKTLAKYNRKSDQEVLDFFLTLFLQKDVPAESRDRLVEYQKTAKTQTLPVYWSQEDAASHRVRALCHLVLALPEYQLD
jgi:uncharacterized protein (DUF1800 family)